MTRISFLFISFCFCITGFSQSTNATDLNLFNYKWLNKKFPLDTLVSYNNDTLILSETQKNYVINFWFTSCPPCVAEIKWLNKLKEDYQSSELEFLAVSFESKESLNNFLESHNFKFNQIYLEQKQINENFLANGYPTTIILDKNKKVVFQKSGGHANEEDAKEIYKSISEEIEKLRLNN
jgi:cytochrome c biogenesis protein CcmG/thiol:disulfide interchange protein DsbE